MIFHSSPKELVRKEFYHNRVITWISTNVETEIQENATGAGLGLYMVLQKVIAISFEVTPEKTTRVTAGSLGPSA